VSRGAGNAARATVGVTYREVQPSRAQEEPADA
jgi:hypothetical protein